MNKGNYMDCLLRSSRTVFSFKDVALLWGEGQSNAARVRLSYYVRKGQLIRLRQGLYAKDKNYNKLELASRVFTPAYISFETVLASAGVIFQYYSQIFVASYLTREIICDKQTYIFRKIKDQILINKAGVVSKDSLSIASKERAFLDILYLNKNYYFDNLTPLDFEKVLIILPIYNNHRLTRKVEQIIKNYKLNN